MKKLTAKLAVLMAAVILLTGCVASNMGATEPTEEIESQQENMQLMWVLSNREDENASNKSTYTYDAFGRIIRFAETKANSPVVYYTYDDGSLTERFLAAGEEAAAAEEKNERKQALQALCGNPTEEYVEYKIIHIDEQGLPATQMCLDSEANVKWTMYFTYDNQRNCVRELTVYTDHVLDVECTYEDHDKAVLRKSYDSAADVTSISQRKFDEEGHLLFRDKYDYSGKYEQLAEKKLTSYWEYEYDSQGRRLQETEYNAAGEPQLSLSYQYDDIGNVSRRVYHYPASGGSVAWRYGYQVFQVSQEQADMLYKLYDDVIGFVIFNFTDTSAFRFG